MLICLARQEYLRYTLHEVMSVKYIDIETWARRDAYKMFSGDDYPFYNVCFEFDVTQVRAFSKREGLSFYHVMIWLVTKAVNSVPALRQRVRGDSVVELDRTDPSFTELRCGEECFYIVNAPWQDDIRAFCEACAAKRDAQHFFIDNDRETDELIYISCMPWFDFTTMTNEHFFLRDDTVPRITWGKYVERGGRYMMHMSVEVNHRLVDGVHLGRFYEAMEREMTAL